jgi:tetratricopeptide (TPR) repeat protein
MGFRSLPFALLAVAALCAATIPPAAARAETSRAPARPVRMTPEREYVACMKLARTRPQAGYDESLAWETLGGGAAARHCGAVALMGLGRFDEAAASLERLGKDEAVRPGLRAELLAQAAQARMVAGQPARADADQKAALVLAPDKPDIMVDRAVTLGRMHRYKEVVALLTRVLKRQPNRVEALTLRATAYRFLGQLGPASADIDRALTLQPGYADALLERGIIRHLRGDDDGARADWREILKTVPKGLVRDEAKHDLGLLDAKTK